MRMVRNKKVKKTLRLFIKTVRGCLNRAKKATFRRDGDEETCDDYYVMRAGKMYFRIGSMEKHGKWKKSGHAAIIEYIGIVRWCLDRTTFLCRGADRTLTSNHAERADERLKLEGIEGSSHVRDFLRSLFENVENPRAVDM